MIPKSTKQFKRIAPAPPPPRIEKTWDPEPAWIDVEDRDQLVYSPADDRYYPVSQLPDGSFVIHREVRDPEIFPEADYYRPAPRWIAERV